ncbi:MAG: DUF6550 family protein [Sedimentibacter saalensis]|uniref:DUF6550 family protein n=1 Tax=Sedimentibacter saalensis TaxID=130788 RepID=UPI002B212DA0|nr:DUF6550 family protein [Sedimentibacter saalensis]MEA5094061.1 DUF6550 family protein [Sedimentibacter saalensis]
MKNINNRTKKYLFVASGVTVIALLIAIIGSQFEKEPVADAVIPQNKNEVTDVMIDKSEIEENEDDIIVEPVIIPEQIQTDTGAIDTGTEQKIQGDVPEKPTYTEEQLTDPTQKPNGEKVEPSREEIEEVIQEAPITETNSEPQGGDKKDGQIYLPGFGWVKDEGGGGEGTVAEDMYENGNKIGDMN